MRFAAARGVSDVCAMADLSSSAPTAQPGGSGCFKWFALILCVLLVMSGVVAWKFFDKAWAELKDSVGWVRELPGKLTSQDITVLFRESVTQIASTDGDVLEVATLETDETVTKYDMRTALSNLLYLGTTTSEIRTPVVYRYHIRLSDPWQLGVQGERCIVQAPAVRPSVPPAIRTDRMEKKSEAGWLRFNAAENLAALERDLTPALEKRAGNRHHIDLVREASRKSVAEFVKKWLLQSEAGKQTGVKSVVVVFPDDPKAAAAALPPTVTVEAP